MESGEILNIAIGENIVNQAVEEDFFDTGVTVASQSVAFIEFRDTQENLIATETFALDNGSDYSFVIKDASGENRSLRVNNIDRGEAPFALIRRRYDHPNLLGLSYNQSAETDTVSDVFQRVLRRQTRQFSLFHRRNSDTRFLRPSNQISINLPRNGRDNAVRNRRQTRRWDGICDGSGFRWSDGPVSPSCGGSSSRGIARWSTTRGSGRGYDRNSSRGTTRLTGRPALRVNDRRVEIGYILMPRFHVSGSVTTTVTRNNYFLRRKSLEINGRPVTPLGWRDHPSFFDDILAREPIPAEPPIPIAPPTPPLIQFNELEEHIRDEVYGLLASPQPSSTDTNLELIQPFNQRNPMNLETQPQRLHKRSNEKDKVFVSDYIRYDGYGHFPEYNLVRRSCSLPGCNSASLYICGKCNVTLCTSKEKRDCFLYFHSLDEPKTNKSIESAIKDEGECSSSSVLSASTASSIDETDPYEIMKFE